MSVSPGGCPSRGVCHPRCITVLRCNGGWPYHRETRPNAKKLRVASVKENNESSTSLKRTRSRTSQKASYPSPPRHTPRPSGERGKIGGRVVWGFCRPSEARLPNDHLVEGRLRLPEKIERHVAATCAERCLPFRQKIKICLPARMAYDVFDIRK